MPNLIKLISLISLLFFCSCSTSKEIIKEDRTEAKAEEKIEIKNDIETETTIQEVIEISDVDTAIVGDLPKSIEQPSRPKIKINRTTITKTVDKSKQKQEIEVLNKTEDKIITETKTSSTGFWSTAVFFIIGTLVLLIGGLLVAWRLKFL